MLCWNITRPGNVMLGIAWCVYGSVSRNTSTSSTVLYHTTPETILIFEWSLIAVKKWFSLSC